jgi:hypothetical protein
MRSASQQGRIAHGNLRLSQRCDSICHRRQGAPGVAAYRAGLNRERRPARGTVFLRTHAVRRRHCRPPPEPLAVRADRHGERRFLTAFRRRRSRAAVTRGLQPRRRIRPQRRSSGNAAQSRHPDLATRVDRSDRDRRPRVAHPGSAGQFAGDVWRPRDSGHSLALALVGSQLQHLSIRGRPGGRRTVQRRHGVQRRPDLRFSPKRRIARARDSAHDRAGSWCTPNGARCPQHDGPPRPRRRDPQRAWTQWERYVRAQQRRGRRNADARRPLAGSCAGYAVGGRSSGPRL